jgi:hypothetical protein
MSGLAVLRPSTRGRSGGEEPQYVQPVTRQHRAERVPSAAAVAWVGDMGEVVEQAAALAGCQRGGRGQPLGNRSNGR